MMQVVCRESDCYFVISEKYNIRLLPHSLALIHDNQGDWWQAEKIDGEYNIPEINAWFEVVE